MTATVNIGGEPRTLGDFSGYKSMKVTGIVDELVAQAPSIVAAAGDFKRTYERSSYVELTRAEARREFRPLPLIRDVPERDAAGDLVAVRKEPVLHDGQPVLGPDPLGHLTEKDWEQSGHLLRISQSPGEEWEWAAMFPVAFRVARESVLRLFALALAANDDLERWDLDGQTDVDARLLEEGRKLLHRMRGDEPVRLATAIVGVIRDEFAASIEDARGQLGNLRAILRRAEPGREGPPPMAVEPASSNGSPTSSTPSPDGTGEASTTPPSPTAPPTASSPPSPVA